VSVRVNERSKTIFRSSRVRPLGSWKPREYAQAERERIESFIEEYERKADAGSDMDIAIRGQQERLEQLEDRIETRREELRRREQIISLAPEVENYCLTLPL